MTESARPCHSPDSLHRLLDVSRPWCRNDVLRGLDYIKSKAAEGAPEWSGLDRPQLLEHFVCYAEMALLLLQRGTPGGPETACFRVMLEELLPRGDP